MNCERCGSLCSDGDGEDSTLISLYYDYETLLCHTCLSDYLLQFMPDLGKFEIETDILSALMGDRFKNTTIDDVRNQSIIVNGLAMELVRKVIMWVRSGN